MDSFDLRGQLAQAIKTLGVRRGAKGTLEFRCIRHEDRSPSAWLGEYRWGCSACGFDEPLDTLADHFGIARPAKGFTVEQYAERKGFSLANLHRWGVKTVTGSHGDDLVEIPYLGADGQLLRAKHRAAAKSFWGPGRGTYLYGLNILAQAPEELPVVLVEGESDCHAAWTVGLLALGVPGATAWKPQWAEALKGRDVYVWQEPGEGGAKLVASIQASFPQAKTLKHDTAKDLADLYKAEGKQFKTTVQGMLSQAVPVSHKPLAHFDLIAGAKLEEVLRQKLAPVEAVPTPLPLWSGACRDEGGGIGLARGWHVTIGAKTGAGKSLLGLNIGAHAVAHGHRVCFVSLEMSDVQLITRYLAILSGQSVHWLEKGRGFLPTAYARAAAVVNDIHRETGAGMYVNRLPLSNLDDVEAAIRYQVEQHGCRMVVTDYMQLATVLGVKDRLECVTEVSGRIRRLGRELRVVSIGLSQLNRDTSNDYDNPPSPQGLMGGSPLENDSDQVLLLDHTHYSRTDDGQRAETRLLLAKNRHGPPKEIPIRWEYETLRVAQIEKVLPAAPYSPGDAPEKDEDQDEDRGEAYEPGELELPRSALEFAYGD